MRRNGKQTFISVGTNERAAADWLTMVLLTMMFFHISIGYTTAQVFDPIQNISSSPGQSSNSHVVAVAQGIYIVWLDNTPGNSDVFFRRSIDGGNTFQPAINLSSNSGESRLVGKEHGGFKPAIAVSGTNVYVVWDDDTSGLSGFPDIFLRRSTDGGASFEPRINLSNNAAASGGPSVVASGSNVYVVWGDATIINGQISSDILYVHSTDGGATFQTPQNLSNTSGTVSTNHWIAASGPYVHVAWSEEVTSGTPEIFYSRSADGGVSFGPTINLSVTSDSPSVGPSIVVNDSNVYVTWVEGLPGGREIVFRGSTDNGANFSSTKDLSNTPGDSIFYRVAASGDSVYVLWSDSNSNTFYVRSIDAGNSFEPSQILSGGGETGDPKLTATSSSIHALWVECNVSSCDTLYRRSTDGITFGPPVNLSASGEVSEAFDVITSNGNIYTLWQDNSPANSDIFFRGASATPAPQSPLPVPVVLVHGWCGGPGSFGEMGPLLRDAGLTVAEPFDYTIFTQVPSNEINGIKIEELAAFLAAHIEKVRQDLGVSQVDIVAHSMGGLIARAWIAGMATLPIPYQGQIRKLVFVGTPNYGAEKVSWNALGLAISKGILFGNLACSDTQAEQMRFGSNFVLTLHDRWNEFQNSQENPHKLLDSNMLFIAGTQDKERQFGGRFECNDPQGCNDAVVDISSAALPNTPAEMIRYIPHKHATVTVPFSARSSIAFITNDDYLGIPTADKHPTYRLVKEFLSTGQILSQCCGEEGVNYNPPHLRGVDSKREGFLVLRLKDANRGTPLRQANVLSSNVQLNPNSDFRLDRNSDASTITIWGLRAPEDYDLTVRDPLFIPAKTSNVHIQVAHPTALDVTLECRSRLAGLCN